MTKPVEISENLPANLRKQVKNANQLIAELNAPPGAPTPNLTAQARPGFVPASAAPAPAAPPAEPTPAARPVVTPDPTQALEHKFSVLQGKYNAETSRMMGMIEQLRNDNERLLQVSRGTPAPAAPRREEQFDLTSVTAKEREEFGEELIQIMARIAKANSATEVRALQEEVNRLKGSVQTTVQIGHATLRDKVYNQLNTWRADWPIINSSQQFVDWLQNIDIMSGRPRHEGLTAAFESGDGSRVVGIFKRFVEEDSSSRPAAAPTPPTALVDPATLVAPSAPRGGGEGAPNGSSGKIWSEQEIDDFYSRVQRGRIPQDEKIATEKEIMAAVTSGRVVPRRDDRHIANSR